MNKTQAGNPVFYSYMDAVEGAFAAEIDYAMLVKIYGFDTEKEARNSPANCLGTEKQVIQSKPDFKHISTSHVERQNLTMRMSMRRFTRQTNAFSKKVGNLECALALHYIYYNFARVHRTLGVTLTMSAGVEGHAWNLEEIFDLTS